MVPPEEWDPVHSLNQVASQEYIHVTRIFVLMVLNLAGSQLIWGQDDTSKKLDEILSQLKELRVALNQNSGTIQARQIPISIDIAGAPASGSTDASVAIVELTDYQCPFCELFFRGTYKELQEKYVKSGKVRFYVMNLPLDIHQNALLAAQAATCSAKQDQFWGMHDRMQANPGHLDNASLLEYAQNLHLDIGRFQECLGDKRIKADIQIAARKLAGKGATGTPSFVVGKINGNTVDGDLVVGAAPYEVFEQKLEHLSSQSDLPSISR